MVAAFVLCYIRANAFLIVHLILVLVFGAKLLCPLICSYSLNVLYECGMMSICGLQNFMAEAAAATAPTQTSAATDQGYSQGYNSYAAPASVYGSAPSSGGHASQPGAYGSVYGGNYGY